ncbi:MAG: hypothetical protein ACRCWR_03280 [Saezia sp.]
MQQDLIEMDRKRCLTKEDYAVRSNAVYLMAMFSLFLCIGGLSNGNSPSSILQYAGNFMLLIGFVLLVWQVRSARGAFLSKKVQFFADHIEVEGHSIAKDNIESLSPVGVLSSVKFFHDSAYVYQCKLKDSVQDVGGCFYFTIGFPGVAPIVVRKTASKIFLSFLKNQLRLS